MRLYFFQFTRSFQKAQESKPVFNNRSNVCDICRLQITFTLIIEIHEAPCRNAPTFVHYVPLKNEQEFALIFGPFD